MLSYGSNRVIPAPFVTISKQFQTSDDGTPLGTVYDITLNGSLVTDMGSPTSSGTFWTGLASTYPPNETITQDAKLGSLLSKQLALRTLFSVEGQQLFIQDDAGQFPPISCNPRVIKLEFPEGGQGRVDLVDISQYAISLQADQIYLNGSGTYEDSADTSVYDYKVSKAAEQWDIEVIDDKLFTYRLSHSLSATGKRFFNAAGDLVQASWQNARDWVFARAAISFDPTFQSASGVLPSDANLTAYNHIHSQHVNELGGTFEVRETWLAYAVPSGVPPAIDEWTVNFKQEASRRANVTVDGTLTGLAPTSVADSDIMQTRWNNAQSRWLSYMWPAVVYARATGTTLTLLNTLPLSQTVGMNPNAGTVTYHVEYDNRPYSVVTEAITENITVTNHFPNDMFALIPIISRAVGPIGQALGTESVATTSVQIDTIVPADSLSITATKPDYTSFIASLKPSSGFVFLQQDEESWNSRTGHYNRNTQWVYGT